MPRINFKTYIRKVLKRVHPDAGINESTVGQVEAILNSVVDRMMVEMRMLMDLMGTKTATSREVQTAVRMILPGELGKHAVSEGAKAVTLYNAASSYHEERKPKGEKRKSHSKSFKAGLQFPVSRVKNRLSEQFPRVGSGAPVYMAAVLEYLCAEILELAGNMSREQKKTRVAPRHVFVAISNDEELRLLFKDVVMDQGTMPNINGKLIKNKAVNPKALRIHSVSNFSIL